MNSFDLAQPFHIAPRLFLAGGVCVFALGTLAMPASTPAAKPAPKTAAAKSAPVKSKTKSSAAKPVVGQTVSGSAGVNYSFKLPAGLTLATPAREKADNFTEFS